VQANRLAADILMPGHLLEKKLLELTQTVELRDEQKIERLAEVAGVSTTAIKIRLGKI
ncbi:ImmA/IrrE family metallo-endopeptidase, partial [Acinetobacter baumannii]|nr:ImmA/IrrE family metallo-endopeptidase [Acinetobacter baumannii]